MPTGKFKEVTAKCILLNLFIIYLKIIKKAITQIFDSNTIERYMSDIYKSKEIIIVTSIISYGIAFFFMILF